MRTDAVNIYHASHARVVYAYAQTKLDDDSPMHARLGRWAVGSEALSQTLMLRRRKLFDVDKGFDEERRKVVEAIEYVASVWTRCANTTQHTREPRLVALGAPRALPRNMSTFGDRGHAPLLR